MIRVLFICMGNICRSPMAEAVFQSMVDEAGLGDQIQVDSAGMGAWHVGETAHRGTLAILRRENIPYTGRARQITREDMSHFTYLIALDREVLSAMKRLVQPQSGTLMLFLQPAKAAGLVTTDEVPDPYYDNTFEQVYSLVKPGCEALLREIRTAHSL